MRKFLVAGLLLMPIIHLQAIDIFFNAAVFNGFGEGGTGVDLPDNDVVEIGTYEAGVFTPLGTAQIGDGVGNLSGAIAASVTGINSIGLGIVGDQLAFKTYNDSNTGSADEFGIFYMDKANDADWAVPSGDGGALDFASTSIDISDLTGGSNILIAGGTVAKGSFAAPSAAGTFGTNHLFLTAPVPEPAFYGLVFGGLVMGFVFYRRRR